MRGEEGKRQASRRANAYNVSVGVIVSEFFELCLFCGNHLTKRNDLERNEMKLKVVAFALPVANEFVLVLFCMRAKQSREQTIRLRDDARNLFARRLT